MASPQALGGALSYNPFISGDQNAKLFALQRQAALASALQTEGLTPLSTNDRQIGGVGYSISPFEGVNKLAQALTGTLGQQQAAKDYGAIYSPQSSSNSSQLAPQMTGANSSGGSFGLPPDISQLAASMYGMEGGPRAVAELVGKFSGPSLAGPTAYNSALGTAAAGNAPAGSMPQGIGQPQPVPQPQIPAQTSGVAPTPQMNASQLDQPAPQGLPPPPSGIQLNAPAPQELPIQTPQQATAPQPMQGESNNMYQARLKAWEAGQSAQSEATGKATGEAIKGAATIDSRYDNAQDLIKAAKEAANNASYGLGVETKEEFHNQFNDSTSVANADFKNRMSQLLTQSLPAVVQASGGRIDIPLLNAIKAAENADISLSPQAKMKVLDNLSVALDQQRQNAHNQVGNITGQAPTTPQNYFTPQQIQAEITRRGLKVGQ